MRSGCDDGGDEDFDLVLRTAAKFMAFGPAIICHERSSASQQS